jgi:hypothetical protein
METGTRGAVGAAALSRVMEALRPGHVSATTQLHKMAACTAQGTQRRPRPVTLIRAVSSVPNKVVFPSFCREMNTHSSG